jgi:hypothetical protein
MGRSTTIGVGTVSARKGDEVLRTRTQARTFWAAMYVLVVVVVVVVVELVLVVRRR